MRDSTPGDKEKSSAWRKQGETCRNSQHKSPPLAQGADESERLRWLHVCFEEFHLLLMGYQLPHSFELHWRWGQ